MCCLLSASLSVCPSSLVGNLVKHPSEAQGNFATTYTQSLSICLSINTPYPCPELSIYSNMPYLLIYLCISTASRPSVYLYVTYKVFSIFLSICVNIMPCLSFYLRMPCLSCYLYVQYKAVYIYCLSIVYLYVHTCNIIPCISICLKMYYTNTSQFF